MNVEVFHLCTHTHESANPGVLLVEEFGWVFGKGHSSDIAASISHFSSRYVGCWFRLEYFTETKPINKQNNPTTSCVAQRMGTHVIYTIGCQDQCSFQSQRKAGPKNVQTIA